MVFRVLVADSMSDEGLTVLRNSDAVELVDRMGLSREELVTEIADCDGLIVRSRTNVDGGIIAAGKNLKLIGRAGIGVDNIDLRAATRAGVIVMNTPEGNATTTAEHALCLMMAMARMLPQATASMKAGKWEKKKFMGYELCGKILGVVGLGNIGRIVADRARGLRMNVIGFDPYFDAEAAARLGITRVDLDDLFERADVITVHTPLTDETRGLVSDAQIERMKQGVLLINCARGGIYDEDALIRGLEKGKLGGVALDVFTQEPPPPDHPLLKHERVICSPHLGASTREAQTKVAEDVAKQMVEFAAGGPARNALNMPRISAAQLKVIGPYLDLAESLGSFCAQISQGAIAEVAVEVAGDITEYPLEPLSTAVLGGVMEHILGRPANLVSARMLAEERQITIREARSNKRLHNFASGITVRIGAEEGTRSVTGTLFGKEPRIVDVDGVSIEAVPEGVLLLITNEDQPGVIGHLGTILGSNQVNISRMHLGLNPTKDGQALSVLSVDKAISKAVRDELITDKVLTVRVVSL